jgi:hypothetical protein
MNCPMAKPAKMAMAMSPSRLDPPRAAILPTSVLGNNNNVLTAKVHMRVAKRKMCVAKATARQKGANIPVSATRLHRGNRSLPMPASASQPAVPRLGAGL